MLVHSDSDDDAAELEDETRADNANSPSIGNGEEAQFNCDICEAKLSTRYGLNMHIKTQQ